LVNHLEKESSKEIMKREMKDSKEALLLTFRKEKKIFGGIVLEIERDSKKTFKKSSKKVMDALRNMAESYFLNVTYHEANEIFQKELVLSMVQMLEIHDIYTKGHSEDVANYAKRLAMYIGLDKKKVDEIYWTGLVHDIGKVLVSKDIINKKEKLSIEEYEEIKKHPVFGYQALKESKITENIAKYVLYHHERVDGDGYPEGLKGNEIPLESRIIAIVDSFDAMISKRTYKESISKEEALKEIKVNLDKQFDSKLGLKFIEMVNREEK
ncbi:MAG: HD-GYP domain-containing protein, partial [Bacillota bacterium]|nr:HD-GYP domain-containing protein [Bacillota bacterium]